MEYIDTENLTNASILIAVKLYEYVVLSTRDIDEELSQYSYDEEKIKDINKWNTSQITIMRDLFIFNTNRHFNGNISEWNTSQVEDMTSMFANCITFNQNISKWDTSNVKNMGEMFANCKNFNGNIGQWDTRKVTDMQYMFYNCKEFKQDIYCWNLVSCNNYENIFKDCNISNENKPLFRKSGELESDYLDRYNDRCNFARNRLGAITYNLAAKDYTKARNKHLHDMSPEERSAHIENIRENPGKYKINPISAFFLDKAKMAKISQFNGASGDKIPEEDPEEDEDQEFTNNDVDLEQELTNNDVDLEQEPVNNRDDNRVGTKCVGSSCMPKRWWLPWRGGKTRKKRKSKSKKSKRKKYTKRTRKN